MPMPNFLSRLWEYPAFWSSIFFLLVLPWVPIIAEWGATGEVKSSSLQIFVALYGLGLGASSRDEMKFGYGVLVAIVFSSSYGSILVRETDPVTGPGGGFDSAFWEWAPMIVGVALFIAHAAERYTRHVCEEAPFFEWL